MLSPSRLLLLGAVILGGMGLFALPGYLLAEPSSTSSSPAATNPARAEIEAIVRDYLLGNPEILREMMAKLQDKDRGTADAARAGVLEEQKDAIFNSAQQVVLGNPQGDVTLVEFFDYNCGYCRKALETLDELLKSDPGIRLVLKEFPVLGEGSRDAARVAVALNRIAPEKYLDFHRALLTASDSADGAKALEVAQGLGVDADRLAQELSGPTIDDPMIEAHQLAERLGIEGTPTFIIANAVVPGAVALPVLQKLIENTRECGKAECS